MAVWLFYLPPSGSVCHLYRQQGTLVVSYPGICLGSGLGSGTQDWPRQPRLVVDN